MEIDLFFNDVEHMLSNLSDENQKKLDFAKGFINEMRGSKRQSAGKTIIGPMDIKTFEFFIFAALVDYKYLKFIKDR